MFNKLRRKLSMRPKPQSNEIPPATGHRVRSPSPPPVDDTETFNFSSHPYSATKPGPKPRLDEAEGVKDLRLAYLRACSYRRPKGNKRIDSEAGGRTVKEEINARMANMKPPQKEETRSPKETPETNDEPIDKGDKSSKSIRRRRTLSNFGGKAQSVKHMLRKCSTPAIKDSEKPLPAVPPNSPETITATIPALEIHDDSELEREANKIRLDKAEDFKSYYFKDYLYSEDAVSPKTCFPDSEVLGDFEDIRTLTESPLQFEFEEVRPLNFEKKQAPQIFPEAESHTGFRPVLSGRDRDRDVPNSDMFEPIPTLPNPLPFEIKRRNAITENSSGLETQTEYINQLYQQTLESHQNLGGPSNTFQVDQHGPNTLTPGTSSGSGTLATATHPPEPLETPSTQLQNALVEMSSPAYSHESDTRAWSMPPLPPRHVDHHPHGTASGPGSRQYERTHVPPSASPRPHSLSSKDRAARRKGWVGAGVKSEPSRSGIPTDTDDRLDPKEIPSRRPPQPPATKLEPVNIVNRVQPGCFVEVQSVPDNRDLHVTVETIETPSSKASSGGRLELVKEVAEKSSVSVPDTLDTRSMHKLPIGDLGDDGKWSNEHQRLISRDICNMLGVGFI